MALLNGVFNTTFNPEQLNARSFAATMLRRFPGGPAPIFALSSQVGKSKAKASTHGYFSKTVSFISTLASSASDVDTNLTVASTTGMRPKLVLHNLRTGENVKIVSVTNATTIVVTRGYGRVAAATINNDDRLVIAGSSFEENSVRPTAQRFATVYIANYTQIFRNAWALSDTARASMAEMGFSNITEDKNDCALMHSADIEAATIFGQPKMDTSGDMPVHATQGIVDAITQYAPTNITAAGSTTSYNQLITMLEPCFAYSTDMSNATERVLFGDDQAVRVLNQIAKASGQVTITPGTTTFGFNFTKFVFYKGTITIVIHPFLNGISTGGMALIMDMPALKYAYMDEIGRAHV